MIANERSDKVGVMVNNAMNMGLFLCSGKGDGYHQVGGAVASSVLQSWSARQAKV